MWLEGVGEGRRHGHMLTHTHTHTPLDLFINSPFGHPARARL